MLRQQEFNQAFVLMQYFGYLGRDPNTAPDTDFSGYNFWLNKLDSFNGDFRNAEMVKAFLVARSSNSAAGTRSSNGPRRPQWIRFRSRGRRGSTSGRRKASASSTSIAN